MAMPVLYMAMLVPFMAMLVLYLAISPIYGNAGPICGNAGLTYGNAGPIYGIAGPIYCNADLIYGYILDQHSAINRTSILPNQDLLQVSSGQIRSGPVKSSQGWLGQVRKGLFR